MLSSCEYQFKVLFYFAFNILVLSLAVAVVDTATIDSAMKTATGTAGESITTLPPPQTEIITGCVVKFLALKNLVKSSVKVSMKFTISQLKSGA